MTDLHKVKTIDLPVQTSIRILILDHNFLNEFSMNHIAKILVQQKQFKILSISNCRITGKEIKHFCEKGLQYAKHVIYLDVSFNMFGS